MEFMLAMGVMFGQCMQHAIGLRSGAAASPEVHGQWAGQSGGEG